MIAKSLSAFLMKQTTFEYFLKASASTKNDLGEYFTPRHIVKTMVRLVNPQIGEKIYDPFCGTGGFLIESFRYIQRNMATGNEELQKILRKSTIYGNEITNTARITKMKDFWYFDVKSDGYSLDNHRRKLNTPSDLSKFEEYRKLDKDQAADMLEVGFEIIPLDEVRKKSNILVGSRYRTASIKSTQYPMISLGDEGYFTICSGGTPSSTIPEYWNGDINWITLADLPADDLVTEIKISERTISEAGLNNSNAKLLPIGTVVVSTRATIGRIGIARTELATNQGFKNIIIKRPDKILPEYLAYILTSQKETMIHSFKLSTNELLICNEMSVSSLITEHRGYGTKLKEFKKVLADYCQEMGYI